MSDAASVSPERAEYEEALTHMARTAGRMPAFDHLGRVNAEHARLHDLIDATLDDWLAARAAEA